MPEKQLGFLGNANNQLMLDVVRANASLEYQQRVPAASQAGMQRVIANILELRQNYNEFVGALVNKIGTTVGRTTSWTNPLAEFKQGLMSYGDTVEEYYVGLIKAHTYDPARDYGEKALFERELPPVQTNYHQITRKEFYRLTINDQLLKRAFHNEGGLSSFVSDVMRAPTTSDNWDEFLQTCQLFKLYDERDGFYKVNVPDVANPASTPADAKKALRTIRSVTGNMGFLNTKYNAAKMPMFAAASDMILITSPEFLAAIDVEGLAPLFHVDRAEINSRIVVIPADKVGISGYQAILTTKDFFVILDTLIENTSMFNPAGLGTNYFFHHHEIISASRFVPAVLFTTGAGTVDSYTPEKITAFTMKVTDIETGAVIAAGGNVQRGYTYLCEPATTTPAIATLYENHGFVWVVTGNSSAHTTVSVEGVLNISAQETSASVTVTSYYANSMGTGGTPKSHISRTLAITPSGNTAPLWPTTTTPSS